MSGEGGIDDSQGALTALVGAAREMGGQDLSASQQAGLVRFEEAVARRTLRSGTRARWVVFGLGLAAAGVAAVVTFQRGSEQLSLSVVNGSVSDEGYVRPNAEGGMELRFSEGSTVTLDPGSSTRVTEIGAHGSRVLLESGRAHVRVAHLPAARWTVQAGPYAVQVVGTEFDVRWSESDQVLDVQVQRGKIIVSGPLATGGLTMEGGQHLVANVKHGQMVLSAKPGTEAANPLSSPTNVPPAGPESAEPAVADPGAPAAGLAGLPPHVSRVRPGTVRPGVAMNASWSKMIAQGDFKGVLADAEQSGLSHTLETSSPADLNALADAARYLRRNDVARRTLLAALERFPHSGTAREAAFFLGGLAEEDVRAGGATTALEWYQRYMSESPRGMYAAHALGRQMLLIHKLRGADAARPIAADYLQRFPSGPYAAPAKKLLQKD